MAFTLSDTSPTDPSLHASDPSPDAVDPRVERTRAAVIAAAGELLVADGPDAVTHATVATVANVSRTTVYKHWPTRADLLRATLVGLGKVMPDASAFIGDVRHDLEVLLSAMATDLHDEGHARLVGMMIARAPHDHTVAAVRDNIVCEADELFAHVVAQGIESGQLRDDLDRDLAMAFVAGSLFFLRFMRGATIDPDLVRHVVDEFVTANAPR